MKPLYLKFKDENEMVQVLLSNGFVQDDITNELYCNDKYLDVIGVIHGKTTYDDNGDVISQEPNIIGWHVNLLVPDDYVFQPSNYVVTVTIPIRKWAGY